MLKPRVVMLIFHSGKMVLTGAKKKEDIDKGFRQVNFSLM
jgi:TATA-box binding protein (TBP) (component of TFIID and TFIIIB)